MRKLKSVAPAVLFFVVAAGLGSGSAAPPERKETAEDLIVPLNVRDPSALVMGPSVVKCVGACPVIEPIASAGATSEAGSRRTPWAGLFATRLDRGRLVERTRVVSLPMDDRQLRPLRPGDRVDVLAVFDVRSPRGKERLCATILQNMLVLEIEPAGRADGKGTLRLRANPNEAQYAALAASQAELSIALRKEGDVEIYPMEMATFVRLFR